jgi:hypothetical protein
VTEYTSNRLDVLTGCVPNGTSSCALNYDTTQTINEDEVRVVSVIDTIGAGNYISGTGTAITNSGRINTIDSGDGTTTIIYTSGNAANVYNYDGQYTRRTNTAAELTNTTGSLTNHYTYDYVGAYIGTIKNVYILGKRNAVLNGASTVNTNYIPTIGEIGEGAELRNSAAGYDVVLNNAGAKVETISGGVFTTYTGSNYALNNASANVINITGGDFRGGDATRAKAINDPDNTAKYTYPEGKKLSTTTETATYHTLSNKVLTVKTNSYYFITNLYTVTFDMQGHGTAPDDQTVESGQKVAEPSTPTADGWTFGGWYKEVAYDDDWDFDNDTVSADTTLFAKWTVMEHTITWKDGNGDTLKAEAWAYGETPVYTGDTPTKAAAEKYDYKFNKTWSPAITTVTKDETYVAQFNRVYPLTLQYTATTEGSAPTGGSTTIKYTYDESAESGSISAPSIRYYNLDHWTIDNDTEELTTEQLKSQLASMAGDNSLTRGFTVNAFFKRQVYTMVIYSEINGVRDEQQTITTCSVGRSMWVNALEEMTVETAEGSKTYKFDHWKIGLSTLTDAEFNALDSITDIRTTYFNGDAEGITVYAVAYYTEQGGDDYQVTTPKLAVRDYYAQKTGETYTISMTLELIAPTVYSEFKDITVGFGFAYDPDFDPDNPVFGDVTSGNWDSTWKSGTYTKRFELPAGSTTLYSYGFVNYTLNGANMSSYVTSTRDAEGIFHAEQSDNPVAYDAYDIITKDGWTGRVPETSEGN